MKRLLALLLIFAMLLSLAACGEKNPPAGENTPEYAEMQINGIDISEYKIVSDVEGLDYNLRAAEYIQGAIASLTGKTLDIIDDAEAAGDYEIVVGETSRELSAELDEDTSGLEFAMLAKGGSVALEGDYFVIAAAAYYFVNTYVKEGDNALADTTLVREPIKREAKNYILLIGDGMGVNQTLLFDYLTDTTDYSDGESFFYGYMLPYLGYSRTSSYSGITDSAAAGTAMATGYKTYNKVIGLDKDGNEVKSLTELAAELGLATAVMSTETNTGATPSAFSAHTESRNNSSEIIDDQFALTERLGTIIDCRGYTQYAERYMKNNEKRIVDTLNTLNADGDGFFIMYEEAHIDKHCSNNDMEKAFLALLSFNQAIARFMEFAFYNPETAVIITADHETGGIFENEEGELAFSTTEHTAANVPLFAWGEGTEVFDGEDVENIEIAHFFADAMGATSFGDRTGGWYDEIYGGESNS